MILPGSRAEPQPNCPPHLSQPTFWRVEGSLLYLTALRPLGFFTWNTQSFAERWVRRGALGLSALVRPLLYASHRVFATRALHTLLRGVSQDRLDLLGEEYFEYMLKPRLKPRGVEKLKEAMSARGPLVLVSQGLDHVMRPLARHLGVSSLLCNRLEFRDGLATGRLLHPVIRPRGPLALLIGNSPDGEVAIGQLCRDLGFPGQPEILSHAIVPAQRESPRIVRPTVAFDSQPLVKPLSVRDSLRGKNVLLIGVTGFIGKVWLVQALTNLPEIGKIWLLVRRRRSLSALERFERLVDESPAFDPLAARHGLDLARFLSERIEVVEGDAALPDLGLSPEIRARLARELDLIVNSSGLTDFNPDLRDALSANVDAVAHLLQFLRQCDHAALLHLSTCYVAGQRDGRIPEQLHPNYTPAGVSGFEVEEECAGLRRVIRDAEVRSESPEIQETLRQEALRRPAAPKELTSRSLEIQVRKNRTRWLRNFLIEASMRRARDLGWPNTYTFTKSLAESLIRKYAADLPVAIVRPSIVESSLEEPFRGWNEGVNTSASLSYLLGTYFRQLPTNERKCLDLIPVDLACRGMMLIATALVNRCHARLYHLATSVANPCDMRRSIELTGLGHRRYYSAQQSFQHWLRSRFDPIPVSKKRYQRLSAPAQRAIIRGINRATSPLLFSRPPFARHERDLEWVEKLIELFEPFILHNQHVFEAENVMLLSAALPEEERADFGYDPYSIDWWDYWINVHIPALRRWSYPLLEGRLPESRSRGTFHLRNRSRDEAERATHAASAIAPP